MIPEYPKFKPLDLKDQELILEHLGMFRRNICELCPGNIYVWQEFDKTRLTMINQDLCLLLSPANESPFFLEPLGRNKLKDTVDICLKFAKRISRASEDFVSLFPPGSYKITPLRDHFDYLYLRQELAELKGKKFDGKRNHIKKFKSRFPQYEFVPLNEDHKKEALDLFERWFAARKESRYFPKFSHGAQKKVLETAFSDFTGLNLLGGAILADGSLKGFMIGSQLNSETVSAHFSYADPDIMGGPQTLLFEACNKTFSSYKYVNLEQDLGIPGLRKAKLSYYPIKLEKKFEIGPPDATRL